MECIYCGGNIVIQREVSTIELVHAENDKTILEKKPSTKKILRVYCHQCDRGYPSLQALSTLSNYRDVARSLAFATTQIKFEPSRLEETLKSLVITEFWHSMNRKGLENECVQPLIDYTELKLKERS